MGDNALARHGRSFFSRSPLELAPALLGCELRHRINSENLSARIVEVEAYLGVGEDPASHAHGGPTQRNREMFETPGRLYVYFTYGMHHCMNVVCESRGMAGAVLLRAAEPILGSEIMCARRSRGGVDISNGPAKLCQAFGIDLSANGIDLVRGPLGIWSGEPPKRIIRSPRIGISKALDRNYRFSDADSAHVSRPQPRC